MAPCGYIDFHCHLDDPVYDGRRGEIIVQCFAAGFSKLVVVADAYSERSLELTAEMASDHAGIECTIGAHPHQAKQYSPQIERGMLAFLAKQRVLAIGEVGLDFHYDFSPRESQISIFRRQIAIAREQALPLVIHSRQAEELVLRILEEEKFDRPVVFHCYTGGMTEASEIVARGYFLSFSGIITFKKAEALRAVVAATPLDRIFSETDSPYLAPEPERGQTNTPLAVKRVVAKIAEIKGCNETLLLDCIAGNWERLAASALPAPALTTASP